MTLMSDDDVLRRLRATYRAIAEATTAEIPPASDLRRGAASDSARPRRANALLIAASLVLVLGGVAALAWSRQGSSATSLEQMTSRMRHATLTTIPDGFGLVTIDSTDDVDRLTLYDGSREFALVTRRTGGGDLPPAPVGTGVEVRGRAAEATGSASAGFELVWTEQPGVEVVLTTTAGDWAIDDVVNLAEQVMMVTDDAWDRLTDYGGFNMVEGADRVVIDNESPRIPGGGRFDRAVYGSLQSGVSVAFANSFTVTGGGTNFDARVAGPVHVVVATPDVATVLIVGNSDRIELTPVPDPGLPSVRVASYSDDRFGPDEALSIEFLDAAGGLIERKAVQR